MLGRSWFLGAALVSAFATPVVLAAPNPQPTPGDVDPRAEQAVRRMAKYLTGLKSFSFDANSVDEAVTTDGQKVQFLSSQHVAVERPNKLRSDREGPNTDTVFRYDGREFSLFGKQTGYYAVAPAPRNLDEAIDAARAHFHLDAPGADLLGDRVYANLMDGVTRGRDLGVESIEGTPCRHLAFRGQDVDWQIWIQEGPQPVPRRFAITTRTLPAQPAFEVNVSNWDPAASLPDSFFTFQPPPGSKEIPMEGGAGPAQP
jgi:hypothetical protein